MTGISGSFTLGDTEGVEKLFKDKAQEYVLQARSEAISVIDEMKKLVQKGLDPGTPIWVWGKDISIMVAPRREEVSKEVHNTVLQVLLDETGELKKSKEAAWFVYPDRVKYSGKTPSGVQLDYVAVPPGCYVEERTVIIAAKPAEPEREEIKRVLICRGPDGTSEEIIE
jgi:hypothetical protein